MGSYQYGTNEIIFPVYSDWMKKTFSFNVKDSIYYAIICISSFEIAENWVTQN